MTTATVDSHLCALIRALRNVTLAAGDQCFLVGSFILVLVLVTIVNNFSTLGY